MICKECGTKLTPEQTTCPNCGALQQQAVSKKRKKPVDSSAVSQQDQPQSSKEQVQWQDRLILGVAVMVTLAAIAWLIFMLMKPADGNDQKAETAAAETMPSTTAVTTTETTTTTVTTYVTIVTTMDDGAEPIEIVSGILWDHKRAINLFNGYAEQTEAYAKILNQYQKDLGDDVQCYSILAPTNASFYTPAAFQDSTLSSEKDCMDAAEKVFQGVIPIDAYGVLKEHTAEPIYARTDHHWFQLGAYYVARAFAEQADVPFADLTTYKKYVEDDFVGSMAYYTNDYPDLVNSPEEFVYYVPTNDIQTTYYDRDYANGYEADLIFDPSIWDNSSYYMVFMSGDDKIVHIQTDCDNDRRLVIFKDSYGNALVPCLTSSFSEIYVCDMRYFNLNAIDFIQEEAKATDVLFCMNVFSANGVNGQDLEVVRTQNAAYDTSSWEDADTEF